MLNIDLQSWVVSLFVQLMQYVLNSCICEFFLRETFTIISISGVLWFWQFLFLFHGTVQVYGFLRDISVLCCSVRSQLFYSTTRSRLCNHVIGSWFLSDSHKYQWLPYVDCSHEYFNACLPLWRASTKAVLLKHHFCCACLLNWIWWDHWCKCSSGPQNAAHKELCRWKSIPKSSPVDWYLPYSVLNAHMSTCFF